jgi:hypothetical protein
MDDQAFGFREATAKSIIGMLGNGGQGTPSPTQLNTFVPRILLGVTSDAINPGTTTGTVTVYDPDSSPDAWSAGSETIEAYAWPTAIDSGTSVVCFVINGRWVAFELC